MGKFRANSPERSGCGLFNGFFGRRWPQRSRSTGSLSTAEPVTDGIPRSSSPSSRRRRGTSNDPPPVEASRDSCEKPGDRVIARPGANHQRVKAQYGLNQQQPQVPTVVRSAPTSQGYVQSRKVPQASLGISGELESMLAEHQKPKGNGFVRASSGNVMLYGNLGNLRQPSGSNVHDQTSYSSSSYSSNGNLYPNSVMGNVVKKQEDLSQKPASLCRALSTRMDPEQLKIMGNEDYKNGNFEEALALYDAAIAIDPKKASYRSNKSAALTALGRLLEAVFECREATKIEPHYQRAHNRLATLNLRLGETEKAMYHFKCAGADADPDVLTKAKNVQAHLNRCTDAKRQRDWNGLLRESNLAISAGADTAPLIYALKAEALLKLNRHQEADEVLTKGPNFSVDESTKFFGPIGQASLLVIRAQVDMAAGRFEDAVAAAQRAARLDVNNNEANKVSQKTGAVAAARSRGNELFKASRHVEACNAYGEGLEYDPYNAILLSNRAACRSKLEQFERAIDDCNAALRVRPSYSKARLRRADCYAKCGKLEASLQDYEILYKENPDNEEVVKAMKEVQIRLKRQSGGSLDINNSNAGHGSDRDDAYAPQKVTPISSEKQFRNCITAPGSDVYQWFYSMMKKRLIIYCSSWSSLKRDIKHQSTSSR
ncbi:inactive TPR repeat-containing thioredoxin TTL3-like isoform X2 [Daucus carota subsp. sativus]|uniref:inactive TPR repeat-containing thioredoxin TTL3-like isoform X2 n=1 Tax=Daucus carota subsp. sativus TaxID=79200 RepID=UPI0007EFC290|nr:PREDICTED: inactive TPR repeat-containing thioredoxin TTL3-like isoform X2 [Daucus carota subsp. sativus]